MLTQALGRGAEVMMRDGSKPLWTKEESVEVDADPAFAFRYLASIGNMTADPGIERVEADGPYRDRPGLRGRTYLVGGGTTSWVVSEVDPGRRLAIDLELRDACLRFEFRFEPRTGGGTIVRQRVSLVGPNAAEYLEGVESGFAMSLADGMRAVADRIDAAATHG
jgi:hypothetical protein